MTQGWIALDIDGTVTVGLNPIPEETASYLNKLQSSGWALVFITGRTFSFAQRAIRNLDFPFYLAVQNGADILSMPGGKIVDQRYLDKQAIRQVENAYRGQEEDFFIYAGYEEGDFCYYRPKHFSPDYLDYFKKLMELAPEPWKAVDSFDSLEQEQFSLIKCLGPEESMLQVEKKLRQTPGLEVITIRDPLNPKLHCLLVTDAQASKGYVIDRLIKTIDKKEGIGKIIAAGDDRNDLSMLLKADIRIVMSTAPEEVRRGADILAKPAEQNGIIEALVQATGVG
jgi:Cof subfamily protein (haloacid dehalogenase superfamily)